MRLLLIGAIALCGFDCSEPKPSAPAPVPSYAPVASQTEELARLDKAIAAQGEHPTGDAAAALYERKGDLLLREMKRGADAKAAYLEAARCYGQSPEATNGPVERADRMRKKAEAITIP